MGIIDFIKKQRAAVQADRLQQQQRRTEAQIGREEYIREQARIKAQQDAERRSRGWHQDFPKEHGFEPRISKGLIDNANRQGGFANGGLINNAQGKKPFRKWFKQ